MTLEEIRASEKVFLTPAEIATVSGSDPQAIRVQARKDAAKLGFPVCVIGNRTKIPRIAFLNWLEGRTEKK